MGKDKIIDIGEIILQKLKNKGISVSWLADKVNCNKSNLKKTLLNTHFIYCGLLYKISIALEEDFFSYYSQKMEEELEVVKYTKKVV